METKLLLGMGLLARGMHGMETQHPVHELSHTAASCLWREGGVDGLDGKAGALVRGATPCPPTFPLFPCSDPLMSLCHLFFCLSWDAWEGLFTSGSCMLGTLLYSNSNEYHRDILLTLLLLQDGTFPKAAPCAHWEPTHPSSAGVPACHTGGARAVAPR